jgi:hypothetical protein
MVRRRSSQCGDEGDQRVHFSVGEIEGGHASFSDSVFDGVAQIQRIYHAGRMFAAGAVGSVTSGATGLEQFRPVLRRGAKRETRQPEQFHFVKTKVSKFSGTW